MVARIAVLVVALSAAPDASPKAPALVVEAPPELAAARRRLESLDTRSYGDLVEVVGLDDAGPPIRVVLAAPDSQLAQEVPPWIAGFAIGEADLVVLFPSRSPRYPNDTLDDVLRHEVLHVLVHRAAGGRPVPRWFHEGFAVAVERPWGVADRTRLASELLFGPRLSFDEIEGLFGGTQGAVTRAYSLSAAVVRDLMARYGAAVPAAVLRQVARGTPFALAVSRVTGQSVGLLEEGFWRRQRGWTMWIPLLASSTVLWLAVMGLGVLAVRRQRRRAADIREQWEREARDGPSDEGGD
ncbi:MAG: hypothetical protein R2745_19465 [Vicinamibacterales bacterium]